MWKRIAIGAATLVVLGTTYLVAQPVRDRNEGPRSPAFSREDATAFLEAGIAALHSGLQLTPDQERLWPAFEKAYRERAKQRTERRFAGAGRQPADDPVARLRRRADALSQEGGVLKALADAAAPLWQSFDDGQKRRFAILSRPNIRLANAGPPDERGAPGGPAGRDGDRNGREGREGRGFGPGGPAGRDGDRNGREGRGFGPGGRDGFGYGREGRGFGGGGPDRRDDYGYGGERRGFGRGGPGGREGDEYGSGRDYGRGSFRGRRNFEERGRGRDERGQGDGDLQGGGPGDRGGRYSGDDEERL